MPLFSVIIPTRDRRELLEEALASVSTQQFRDFEVTVVDDGSADDTRDYLASMSDRVNTVRLEGEGPGAARNAGARAASGDYLAFLDSDDLWLPWTLATFAELIRRFDRPALMRASFKRFTRAADLEPERDGNIVAEAFGDYLSTWPRQLPVGAGMTVVQRDAFLRAGGFTTRPVNLEDHDLCLRLGTARTFVALEAPLAMGWRRHAGNVTGEPVKNVAGCFMLIDTEKSGRYPGGDDREDARRGIITSHARSVSIECARAGLARDAWRIYAATLPWHLALRRWKYLVTFPFVMSAALFRQRQHTIPA
jgi:hypothetical protein